MTKFDRNTWQTPPALFQTINNLYPMVCDTAASALNALLPVYITEQDNSLETPWLMFAKRGQYVWNNPPYSNVSPWVSKAAKEQRRGIGTVQLVFNDPSASWYIIGYQTVCEIWHVVGGRVSYINPATGKRVPGNNRGSLIFIWHPISTRDGAPIIRHVTRNSLMSGNKPVFL